MNCVINMNDNMPNEMMISLERFKFFTVILLHKPGSFDKKMLE